MPRSASNIFAKRVRRLKVGQRGQRPCGRTQRIGGRLAIGFAVAVASALWSAPARAADPYPAGDKSPPQVLAQHFFDEPPTAQPGVASSGNTSSDNAVGVAGSAESRSLAFTGIGIILLLLAALVATAIGFVLWRTARHQPRASNR